MATIAPSTAMSDDLCIVVPFLAKERTPDGSLYVYGKATGPQVDLDDQIADPEWARTAMDDWFKSAANIRQMHSPHIPPAGVGVELEEKDDGFWLRSKIVDPGAQRLVEQGVYKGYSIYIQRARVRRDDVAKNGRIVGGKVTEVSLVDYPCLPSARFLDVQAEAAAAKFTLFKRAKDDTVEYVGTAAKAESADPEPADLAKCAVAGCDCACVPGSPDAGCSCDCTTCTGARATMGAGDDAPKRDYSEGQRDAMADKGQAESDGSYPIKTAKDVRDAVADWGRGGSKASDKEHIIERAKAIGATDELPADWPGSTKSDDAEKGRVYYSNDHKERIRTAMQSVMETLRSLDPDLALTTNRDPAAPKGDGGADAPKLDMRETSTPTPVGIPATAPDFMKRAEVEALVAQAAQAAVEHAQAEWRADLDAAKAAWATERTALEARLQELGAEPDPAAAAYRGPRLAERPSAITKAARTAEEVQQDNQREILRGWLQHGDPTLRKYAQDQLAAAAAS